MNASSWRKAADLITQGTQANQQTQAAATADSSQLESFSLSSLAANDSGPPQVNYGTEHCIEYTKDNFNLCMRDTIYRYIPPDNSRYE